MPIYSYSGFVYDSIGRPLSGATVSMVDPSGGTGSTSQVTGSTGRFSFSGGNSCTQLKCTCDGYEDQIIDSTPNPNLLQFLMQELGSSGNIIGIANDVLQISGVTVTGNYRSNKCIKKNDIRDTSDHLWGDLELSDFKSAAQIAASIGISGQLDTYFPNCSSSEYRYLYEKSIGFNRLFYPFWMKIKSPSNNSLNGRYQVEIGTSKGWLQGAEPVYWFTGSLESYEVDTVIYDYWDYELVIFESVATTVDIGCPITNCKIASINYDFITACADDPAIYDWDCSTPILILDLL